MALADINADGKLDLLVANQRDKNVMVLLGDGKGTFAQAPGSPFPAGNNPNDIAVGDINGDRHDDLAFANHDTKYVTVLLGAEHGSFAPAAGSPFAVNSHPHPHGIAFGDFNGDRNLDFAFSVAIGDVNGDGMLDLAIANYSGQLTDPSDDKITILLGSGDGTFRPAPGSPFKSGSALTTVAVGDINGDRIMDVTAGNYGSNYLTVLLGGVVAWRQPLIRPSRWARSRRVLRSVTSMVTEKPIS